MSDVAALMKPDAPGPTSDRVTTIDTIRGFALLGVLLVNLRHFSGMPHVHPAIAVFFEGKSVAIFAMLFGLGLALQRDKAGADSGGWVGFMVRRQLALLAIGCGHAVLAWNGDILVLYAIAGLLAAPLLRLPRARMAMAIALVVALDAAINFQILHLPPWADPTTWAERGAAMVPAAEAATAHGSWVAALIARSKVWIAYWLPLQAGMLLWTCALFATGGWIWRSGVFKASDRYRKPLAIVAAVGIGLGFLMGAALVFREHFHIPISGAAGNAFLLVVYVTAPCMGLGYAAAILLMRQRDRLRVLLDAVAPLGRMGLSTYLAQSFVCTAIFSGWGLGRWRAWGWGTLVAFGLALYVLQAVAATWWLRRFHFGPAEWAWRCLTYGRLQPFVKQAVRNPLALDAVPSE